MDATTPTTSPTDTHTTTKIFATERGNVNITYFIHLQLFVNINLNKATNNDYLFSLDTECKDDDTWIDDKYGGTGSSKCSDMIPDLCNNYGDYSTEARRVCPKACGICQGRQLCRISWLNNSS